MLCCITLVIVLQFLQSDCVKQFEHIASDFQQIADPDLPYLNLKKSTKTMQYMSNSVGFIHLCYRIRRRI